ncbi:MAG: Gfo/Idh/MocA family protein [Promethearchaeota archaeon]
MGKKKSVVIIGMGSHANGWRRELIRHPDFEITGIVDTDTELLDNMHLFGLEDDDGFISIDDYVEDKGVPDLAVICTPIYTHHVLVKETMDHGINVICEKNMASSIYQGRQMVQLALDNPELTTAIGHQYRYFTHNWLLKAFIQEHNDLGDLSFIRIASAGNWGEHRRGWRRWLQEIYAEDMMPHHVDLLRYVTGMDIVQVKADTFIPRFSEWQGSSTVIANFALAHPDDYNHRHNWVWCHYYGDWQARGKKPNYVNFYFDKGQVSDEGGWLKIDRYTDKEGSKWEEDAFLATDAGDIEHMGTNYESQGIILEQVSRSIDSGGKNQPLNNFVDIFKSFAVSMAVIESSRTGKSVWVPDYWKDLGI